MIVAGHLDLRYVDGENWELLSHLDIWWKTHKFRVWSGFITDLASVPRVARMFVPKGRRESRGAVVHDWIYRGHTTKLGITRKEADEILLDIMKEDGVGYFRRYVIYNAVRVGGRWSFKG